MLQHRPFCLASSSPRRQAFLERYGFRFECRSPEIDETPLENETVESFVSRMAREKARQVKREFADIPENAIILAGDTVVFLEKQILGKPEDKRHAKAILRQLSGHVHQVHSGFTLLDVASGDEITETVSSEVCFRNISEEMIEWYVNTGEPLDKAGAYSIQGLGTLFAAAVVGSYNNVVGFPIERILPQLLRNGWVSFPDTDSQQKDA